MSTEFSDVQRNSPATSAGYAYERLRDGLIWGRWKPGTKLKPQHLKTEFSTTTSALREALIRLAGEGFVSFEEQRGFSTIQPSRKSFQELHSLRVLLEKEGLTLSVKLGDLEWETNLIAAHQRLTYIEQKMLQTDEIATHLKIWSRFDAQFHAALIAGCQSELLKKEHRRIYDRYRAHAVEELGTFGFRGETTLAEHNHLAQAAIAREASACVAAIESHVTIYRSQKSNETDE